MSEHDNKNGKGAGAGASANAGNGLVTRVSSGTPGDVKKNAKSAMLAALKQTAAIQTRGGIVEEDLLLVIDSSGSMVEDTKDYIPKMEAAKQAAQDFVRSCNPSRSHIGLTEFGCVGNRLLVEPSNDLATVLTYLGMMHAGGGTPMFGALMQSIDWLKEKSSAKLKRIILLTDGQATDTFTMSAYNPNVFSNEEAAAEVAKVAQAAGIIIDTIGFGKDFDAIVLDILSGKTGGKQVSSDTARSLVKEFLQLEAVNRGLLPSAGQTAGRRP